MQAALFPFKSAIAQHRHRAAFKALVELEAAASAMAPPPPEFAVRQIREIISYSKSVKEKQKARREQAKQVRHNPLQLTVPHFLLHSGRH